MPLIPEKPVTTQTVRTKADSKKAQPGKWWEKGTIEERAEQVLATGAFLKEAQQYRQRQAGILARLYGNMPIFGYMGSSISRTSTGANQLPLDRPTFNVIQSVVDTKVSRLTQSRPRPVFLTDNGDYRERTLSKKLNNFIVGELYRTKAYELGEQLLRDASALGDGLVKVYEGMDGKVALERVLCTELFIDHNDGLYGAPRTMYQFKLVDRDVLAASFPKKPTAIANAQQAYPDNSADSSKTVSDQVMVVEAWHLPSSPDAGDGKHIIACSEGSLLDEEWDEDTFPFVRLKDTPRLLGYWSQGAAERLMGTQVEINKLLITISQAINIVGVPRVFVEEGSKVVSAHLNNLVGAIVKYQGTKPVYEVAPCMPQEVYSQLERLIQSAFQQEGVSMMAAASTKPAGLNSGAAIREYDDVQSDRLATLGKHYDQFYIDLAYAITRLAKKIGDRDGKYTTVFVDRQAGAREVELPDLSLVEDKYVIQCFNSSSLPRDPAGRNAKIIEYMQAGILSMQEGRRLLDFPDIEQVERLASSGEERILKYLDCIVEDGEYTPPDSFMDAALAMQLATQYYNLHEAANLPEDRAQMLRTFFTQAQELAMAAAPQPPPQAPGAPQGPTQAVPEAAPTSPMLPQAG